MQSGRILWGSNYFRRDLKDLGVKKHPKMQANKTGQSLFACGHAISMASKAAEAIMFI